MNDYLSKCFEIYESSLSDQLNQETIIRKKREIRYFLHFLSENGINDLNALDLSLVYNYVLNREVASQTRSLMCFEIRNFFNIMCKAKVCDYDGYKVYPIIFTNKRDRIPSFYSTSEVKELINSIDLNIEYGVRDKCFILLAAQMGLRQSDILGLKFCEILWDKDLISKVQQKTKIPISVPMPHNIKLLLISYIRDYRPHSSSDYVFINPKTNNKYSRTEVYAVMGHYLPKTTINTTNRKRGPHSLRHSLATNLLEMNTPMPVITGILGHKNLNTTSAYLSIDIESLRSICLEVPTYG